MNLPLPLAGYLYQHESLPPQPHQGELYSISRTLFDLKFSLDDEMSIQLVSCHCSQTVQTQFIQAWLLGVLKMARQQFTSRLITFDAREVENYLRQEREKPLWPKQIIPKEILLLDQQVRSSWIELKIKQIQCQNGDVFKGAQTYIERLSGLKLFCAEFHLFFKDLMNLELVALEREGEAELVVVSLRNSQSVQEILNEVELLKMIEESWPVANLKWVAEPQ